MTGPGPATVCLRLADGRQLACCQFGDPAGAPVLYCHGFPGSGLEARFAAAAAHRAGVCLLAPDRPGFGRSDPRGAHELDAWSDDAVALLDALGLERAAVLGISGGAPYALGLAARRAERVAVVALIGPLGPLDGADGTAGMSALARLSFHLAHRRPRVQAGFFHVLAGGIRLSPERAFRLLTGNLGRADRALLAQPDICRIWIDSLRAAVDQGADAAIAELRRYARPWPFAPAAIATPVRIWHGQADRVVPVAHGRRLARELPRVAAQWPRDEGHFSLPVNMIGTVLADLRAGVAGGAQP